MYVEEICIPATADDFDTDQPSEDREVAAVLEQVNWMRRCESEFTLFNDHRLSIKAHGFMQRARDYTIDVGILDPKPKRSLKVCWSYFLIFAVLCLAAWSVSYFSFAPDSTLLPTLLGIFAGFSLILAVYRSHDRLVFYSQYGRAPLVVLFNRSPDRTTLNSFIETLVGDIKDAKVHNPGAREALSEELKAHRRLMEEGAISRKRYDIVKQRILSQHTCTG